MNKRGSGILMHITSLPSPFGIGDLGPGAYEFVDFLLRTKQTYWQVLPLNPTSLVSGNSPYASFSAFAGNPLLISPELMIQMEFLNIKDIENYPDVPQNEVDYRTVITHKEKLFEIAFQRFKTDQKHLKMEYRKFCRDNSKWLQNFATFMAFKVHFRDQAWSTWPVEIRDRQSKDIQALEAELIEKIEFQKFNQFVFFTQWNSLKKYCNDHGVQLIGDIPYYVNYDSAEVWTNPNLFKLNNEKKPEFVAGVPPDYFSETGQLWGNPVYCWDALKATEYSWWMQRIEQNLKLYNIVRIDHFRGFLAYWEVPASDSTATNGKWIKAPAEDLFNTLRRVFPKLPILAEDLGVITQDVKDLMDKFELPGMRILLFAFDKNLPHNSYAPHNHIKNCVVYTGTHDNNTIKGWFGQEATEEDRKRLFQYLGREVRAKEIHWELIRLAMMSVANLVIFPLQDVLGLGAEHRMNKPATLNDNWKWRLQSEQLTPSISKKLRTMTEIFGRE